VKDCTAKSSSLTLELAGLIGSVAADIRYGPADERAMWRRFVVDLLILPSTRKPCLAAVRNGLPHGDPFSALPWKGLLELLGDLIDYAYRDWSS
jgi:hypothetical protein